MCADIVAVARVVDHHEQHRLLAELLVLGVALLPFLDPEGQVVGELLVEDRARMLVQAFPARGVGQHRMLDNTLVNGLDERIVADRLHEDRAVVVARRGGHVDLKGETPVFLQHSMVDVTDAAEPRHALIVDVMRFVVEDGKLVDLADELAEIGLAVGRLARRPGPERLQEMVGEVVVFYAWFA